MKILVIDDIHPYLQQTLKNAGLQVDEYLNINLQEFKNLLPRYNGLILRSKFSIDKTLIDIATNLQFIARVGAGTENIDVVYAESKNIICFKAPEGNRDAVGEHALGMLLSLFNQICKANSEVKQGIWQRNSNRGTELAGKTIGIIGYGNMGSAFAEKLRGFNVEILAYDKYKTNFSDNWVKEVQLAELFDRADIISLHVPLTPETHYLIDDQFLQQFKKNIYIINTARGQCLNTIDLVKNLKTGKVLGACLDVLEIEAKTFENFDSPSINPALQAAIEFLQNNPNVLLTPHVAGWTHESNFKMAKVTADKIINSLHKFNLKH